MSEPSITDGLARRAPLAGCRYDNNRKWSWIWGLIQNVALLKLPVGVCATRIYHKCTVLCCVVYQRSQLWWQRLISYAWPTCVSKMVINTAIDILRLLAWISAYPISSPLVSVSLSSSILLSFLCLLFSHLSDSSCEVPAEPCLRIISGLN